MAALASSYNAAFEYERATEVYRQLIALLDAQGLGATRQAAPVLNNWSVMLHDSGQLVDAAAVAARAVRTAREADSENGASLSMLTVYGSALAATGEDSTAVFDEALDKARRAGSHRASSRRSPSRFREPVKPVTSTGPDNCSPRLNVH